MILTGSSDVAQLSAPPPIERARDALFLDFDGTLADLAATPGEVRVTEDIRQVLAAAHRALGGRLAIVSGRSLTDLDELLALPDLPLAGVHGLEMRHAPGVVRRRPPSPGMERARARLVELGAREPRLLIEDKGLGVALHYRQAPDLASLAEREAHAAAEAGGVIVQTGKMVFEVRERGADKGAALRAFMSAAPFASGRPIFVGDDDTDECAFVAAAELGGHGILVGAPRVTAARYGLANVTAVAGWIATAEGAAR